MQSITQGIEQTATAGTIEESGFVGKLRDIMLAVAARRHTRRIVRGLSEGQLRDSGIDRAAILGDRPVIEADVGLATYLASLR